MVTLAADKINRRSATGAVSYVGAGAGVKSFDVDANLALTRSAKTKQSSTSRLYVPRVLDSTDIEHENVWTSQYSLQLP